MSKYIDAEKLTTIIEERKAQQDQWTNRYHDPINQGISHELTEILSIVDSLQQEQLEVELEKELDRYLRGEFQQTAGGNFNNYIQVARHFAEWGAIHLNARKED